MNVSVELIHKPGPFQPKEYAVKAVEKVSRDLFRDIMNNPQKGRACIANHINDMSFDENTKQYGVLVLHDGVSQDALVIHSSGYEYCREAAFVPGFIYAIEQEVYDETQEMVEDEIDAYICSPEDETPHQPFISWDRLGERLGFAVSRESALRGAAMSAIEATPELKGLEVTDGGVKFDIYTDDDIDIKEQDQQVGSVQL